MITSITTNITLVWK